MSTLVETSREEVLEKARVFVASRKAAMTKHFMILPEVEEELIMAVTLLEAREAMAATTHLDSETQLAIARQQASDMHHD